MAKTDIPSKRLIQLRPVDWAKLVLKDNGDIRLTEMKPGKNPKVESRLDVLYWVDNDEDSFIIDNELIGLYSLLPLMEIEEDETDEEIIEKSVKVIETIEDEALRGDSLAAMSIMSADRYSSDIIGKYVRREMLMNSPLYDKWMEEEREESRFKGRLEGELKNSRDTLILLLESKFDFIPNTIIKRIEEIEDLSLLKGLTKKILAVSSIGQFEELLDKVKKLD